MVCNAPQRHACQPERHFGVIVAGDPVLTISEDGDVSGSLEDGIAWIEKAIASNLYEDSNLRCTLAYLKAIKKAKEK